MQVRREATSLCGIRGSPNESLPVVVECLVDSHYQVRDAAAAAVGQLRARGGAEMQEIPLEIFTQKLLEVHVFR